MSSHQSADGVIIGRVLSAHHQPICDAVVMIAGDSPAHHDLAILTNDQGSYRFDGLTPGDYTLLVNAEGYAPQTGHVRVVAGQPSQLAFVLLP